MYKSGKPVRNKEGKIIGGTLMSKDKVYILTYLALLFLIFLIQNDRLVAKICPQWLE
jgi:hypothetical protein